MKKIIVFWVLAVLAIASCKNDPKNTKTQEKKKESRKEVALKLTPLTIDAVSVRSLEYSDEYWFAASKNSYGIINPDEKTIQIDSVPDMASALEFRSIAVTDRFTFILNAGAPAHLFKINRKTDEIEKVYTEDGEGVFYDSMKFWNDEEGIVYGDPTQQGETKCISVLKTYDGGRTWKKITCDNLPNFIDGEAGFAASNSNIVISGDKVWIATGGTAARVLYSADRGESFTVQETPIMSGGEMTGIFAMDFYNENLGIIIGGNWSEKENNSKNMAITRNGGNTWELLAEGTGPGYCSDILFVPGTGGRELLAVGTSGLWWSGDQGKNWSKLSDEGYYTAVMENSKHGVLTGYAKAAVFELVEID